jgi:AcrR family transcriptional regulator
LNNGRSGTHERLGRRRRFDADTERAMIIDAAIRLMTQAGSVQVAVTDVLEEAGLSTRSFYRHFDSRDALLAALVQREAELVARSMRRAMGKATDPSSAVEAWLRRLLDTWFRPAQAARSGLFTGPEPWPFTTVKELAEIRWIMSQPLADLLRNANRTGALVSLNPDADALSVFALVGAAVHGKHAGLVGRDAIQRHVKRFAWPALGITESPQAVTD